MGRMRRQSEPSQFLTINRGDLLSKRLMVWSGLCKFSVVMLPSALWGTIRFARCRLTFSLQPVLPSDLRPVVSQNRGTWARRLAKSRTQVMQQITAMLAAAMPR